MYFINKIKNARLEKNRIEHYTKINEKFIREELPNIISYFRTDDLIELIIDYKGNNIEGFFIKIRDKQLQSCTSIGYSLRYSKVPNCSHQLSTNEFCSFLNQYCNCFSNKEQEVMKLMDKHKKLLEWY